MLEVDIEAPRRPALLRAACLNEEEHMSLDVCRTCKHKSSCTYPRNQVIVQCEEYEYADTGREALREAVPALTALKSANRQTVSRPQS